MNFTKSLMIICILLTSACDFDVPLSAENAIPIDRSLLGVWFSDNGEESISDLVQIDVMEFSDNEYLIEYYQDRSSLFFRAYLIKVSDRLMLQAQLLGNEDEPVATSIIERFAVISYTLESDHVIFSKMNAGVIDKDTLNSEALREAFIEQKDNPKLFINPTKFKRMKS